MYINLGKLERYMLLHLFLYFLDNVTIIYCTELCRDEFYHLHLHLCDGDVVAGNDMDSGFADVHSLELYLRNIKSDLRQCHIHYVSNNYYCLNTVYYMYISLIIYFLPVIL